ncbi:MAG: alcohol dehydrogenase catalytic domain-containing protein, partial [Waddliaceae bacterium]
MQLQQVGEPLKLVELPIPNPKSDEFLIKIEACAVCRTDLHIIEGDLKNPKLPLTLGHQIVGT